ncbi:MAG: HutD/Ves family protein, partial [Pseudomonadota bacterium]
MTGRPLRPKDYQVMPWKNGGGVTTEIWKAVSPAGEMLWRLSIADVGRDSPFSPFPGIDRTIMVIEGNGMELTVEGFGTRQLDRPFEPFAFSGDAKTTCRLIDGPIRDFNLMVMRGFGEGTLRVLQLAPKVIAPLAEDTVAVHMLH